MAALRFVRSVLKSFQAESGLEPRLFGEKIRVTAAEPGRVEFELDIDKEHTNRLNIIHGGTIASMVDLGGSLAVASKGLYATGVSTDLNVTFLNSGGRVGDVLKAVVTCDKFGKTLAYTSIKFINSKGEIAARGSHTNVRPTGNTPPVTIANFIRYIAQAWKHPENIVDELSPKN